MCLGAGCGELGGDPAEQARKIRADRVHGSDDGDGDAGSNQAILDGRGARLVLDETLGSVAPRRSCLPVG